MSSSLRWVLGHWCELRFSRFVLEVRPAGSGFEFRGARARGAVVAQHGNFILVTVLPCRPLFGGNWSNGANCGSRSSNWSNSPLDLNSNNGVRGLTDTLIVPYPQWLSTVTVSGRFVKIERQNT